MRLPRSLSKASRRYDQVDPRPRSLENLSERDTWQIRQAGTSILPSSTSIVTSPSQNDSPRLSDLVTASFLIPIADAARALPKLLSISGFVQILITLHRVLPKPFAITSAPHRSSLDDALHASREHVWSLPETHTLFRLLNLKLQFSISPEACYSEPRV